MKKRALIFAGAGASYAVDREAYPTTVQFFEKLPDNLRENSFVRDITKHLAGKFGEGPPDVEKILWCLDELQEYLAAAHDPRHPASWFLPNNALQSLINSPHQVNTYAAAARDALKVINPLRSGIAAKVYDFYSKIPSQSSLNENWQELFNFLASQSYFPDIITTNYDLVIEHAAEFAGQSRGTFTT